MCFIVLFTALRSPKIQYGVWPNPVLASILAFSSSIESLKIKNGQQAPLKPAASKGYSDLLRPLFFQVDLTLGLDCRNAAWATIIWAKKIQ